MPRVPKKKNVFSLELNILFVAVVNFLNLSPDQLHHVAHPSELLGIECTVHCGTVIAECTLYLYIGFNDDSVLIATAAAKFFIKNFLNQQFNKFYIHSCWYIKKAFKSHAGLKFLTFAIHYFHEEKKESYDKND